MTAHHDRHAFINGKPCPAEGSSTFESIDPSIAEPIAKIHTSSLQLCDKAISAASMAFPGWSQTSSIERSKILLRAAGIIRERRDQLAILETQSTGKPFSETSLVDIPTGADVLEYYASLVASGGLNGEYFPLRSSAWVYTSKNPLGVCVGIGAWNYPIQIALWKSAPCLAAGNCMVYKPSEFTSLHAEVLGNIYKEAGLPDGVFNVVYGAGEVGAYLTQHPGVAKVSFTGQVSTGQKVAASAAGQMKSVTMELGKTDKASRLYHSSYEGPVDPAARPKGGKSPLIVLPDADINKAVDGAILANFFSTGQVCTNGTRVFIPESIKLQFETLLVEKMKFIRPGELYAEDTNFGPLVSKVHYEKVVSYIKHGIEVDNARLVCGGMETSLVDGLDERIKRGYWVSPTVFSDCSDDMKIVREEIFGPVMTILTYRTVDEAIKRANTTTFGLAAGVFGGDINACHDTVRRLEAGITFINTWGESPAEMAVGGWKLSGLGVENGRKGLDAWVTNKSTLVEMSGTVPTVFNS